MISRKIAKKPAKVEPETVRLRCGIEQTFDREFIDNLADMCGSGIAYWCSNADVVEPVYPLLFTVEESELRTKDPKPVRHQITVSVLLLGIVRILRGETRVQTKTVGAVAMLVVSKDTSIIDTDDADLIVQAGLYNDVVWG
jgi:hypothetical protein